MERLIQPRHKTIAPYENLSHHTNEDRDVGRREYKNVFHEGGKPDMRNYEVNGHSALLSGRKEEFKPFSYGGKPMNIGSGRAASQYKKAKPSSGDFFLKRRP